MRTSFSFALALAVGLPILAGCSSVATPPSALPGTAPAPPIGGGRRDVDRPLLYVADTYSNDVLIYKQRGHNQQAIRTLTQGITFPRGVWGDKRGNLWVANTATENGSTILRFRPGATRPDLVLDDPYYQAYAVWTAADGSVYVVNVPYSGQGEIVEYLPHQKTPQVIGDSNLSFIWSVVGDAKGDLFAGGYSQYGNSGEIDERPTGSSHWTNTGIKAYEPAGLGFDASGNLVLSDIGSEVVEIYAPGQKTPSNTIPCSSQCISFAFNHRGNRLWVLEFPGGSFGGYVEEWEYPSGKVIDSISEPPSSDPQSVATTPDLYP